MNADRKCNLGPSFFSPKRNSPRKLDSRKNAKTPSMASVCPMTPPAYVEKRAQFVPNWNSIGIPVTTPTAKLIANIFPQNLALLLYSSLPVRSDAHFIITMSSASPIVSCGKR